MKRLIIIACALVFVPLTVRADCWKEAGQRYSIEPMLLRAIAEVESGMDPKARNHNRDGSYDVGLMQVNSRHLPRLKEYGITEDLLVNDACTSVMVGAWILAEFIQHVGYNWKAVGSYNAGTSPRRAAARKRYVDKVWSRYRELQKRNQTVPVARTQ